MEASAILEIYPNLCWVVQHKYALWNDLCAKMSCTKGPHEPKTNGSF
jgi:hypothetical protein